ncbi:PREDICTED: protein FAM186B isoform X1 [Mandrillus leucophaeus]|uniref:protein FAM186B isoform X1 n=1 Tax=Mandrillus leucophaeus TaxID=9568 RepID=UPI0005F3F45B|nr:PREDICTED: protein FAM186B isoform X1 [Mandrillus leucophaeus]
MEKDDPPQLVTPTSVKAIILRIEAAQLTRAQEVAPEMKESPLYWDLMWRLGTDPRFERDSSSGSSEVLGYSATQVCRQISINYLSPKLGLYRDISTQLLDILDNVNCVINRFQEELGYDLKENAKSHQTDPKGKKRFILLDKIASFSKDAKMKEKHLYDILRWLGDWGDTLTYEIGARKSEEEEAALDEWIEVTEKMLPLSLIATKRGIESLTALCSTLIEGQKKRSQVSKCTFWQGWQGRSPQTSPSHPQPLSPEQMLQDQHTMNTKASEVTSMLQELLDSTMFSKGEVRAIRYMATVVENLNKALILQHKENRSLETKYRYLQMQATEELSSQRLHFQQFVQVLESRKDALLKQVEILGGRYHDLLLTKQALEFQLKKAQAATGQAEDPAEVSVDSPGPSERETLPRKETVTEESQQEPMKKEQLFSPLPPGTMAMVWDSGATAAGHQPLSTMTGHSRVADVFSSKDTKSLEPVLLPSVDRRFPKKWERPVAESSGHKDEDLEDYFQEKGGLQIKFHCSKQLSLESSRQVTSESQEKPWEKGFGWETRRQLWLEEEEMWQQRQKKWALLEQEHQEKLRQWKLEDLAREQQQRWVQLEKEQESLGREPEQLGEDVERRIFTPASRWRDLEKAELSLVPAPSRTQSAHQSRRPHLPMSPSTQQPALGKQRPMSSVEFTYRPRTRRVPTKPKKSASFPVTGTSIRRLTQPSLQISPATLKKVYHMDMEAQRKNLKLLSEESELRLPHYLRSKALELTTTTMELGALRLQYLCHKYIFYRRLQSLRQEAINHVQIMKETEASYKAQNLYIFLENIDHLQSLRLQAWTDKQKRLEEKRRECLSSMVTMFPKLLLEWNVHLNIPEVTSPKPKKCKLPAASPRHIHPSGPTCKQPFQSRHRECAPLQMARLLALCLRGLVAELAVVMEDFDLLHVL